ncbi:hypothetical protein XENTR_v10022903 [Xenopus tropicalis]|nr:hypothetical protein XENTR_v10022903 [Xenopus tropicalis]
MAGGTEHSLLRDKKGLLVAIGSSVDKIIGHFNASRNRVQKAQLGDSRLSPELGYLLLGGLCPSLYSLLGDGLKPFQKDVIVGRRRLSPWSLVEGSVRAAPNNWTSGSHSCTSRTTALRLADSPGEGSGSDWTPLPVRESPEGGAGARGEERGEQA